VSEIDTLIATLENYGRGGFSYDCDKLQSAILDQIVQAEGVMSSAAYYIKRLHSELAQVTAERDALAEKLRLANKAMARDRDMYEAQCEIRALTLIAERNILRAALEDIAEHNEIGTIAPYVRAQKALEAAAKENANE
jgi:hypothetical protein